MTTMMMVELLVVAGLMGLAGLVLMMAAPASPIIKGITTIRWGAGGVVQDAAMAAALVKKVTHTTRGGDPTLIEDTNGYTVAAVLLHDGDSLTITCVDDSAITWPDKGDAASYKLPGESAAKWFLVVDNNVDLERKREGERTLKVEYYVGIDLTPAP